jgi:hypothetical protein
MISFSLAAHAAVFNLSAKARSMTRSMIHMAVEAPGDAPSMATMELSEAMTS